MQTTYRRRKRKKNPAPSTIRRRRHSERMMAALIKDLGGKCAECEATEDLTIDHPRGRGWNPSLVHYTKRLRMYADEAKRGLVRLLCASCNASAGRPDSFSADDFY